MTALTEVICLHRLWRALAPGQCLVPRATVFWRPAHEVGGCGHARLAIGACPLSQADTKLFSQFALSIACEAQRTAVEILR
jgi:hypothetical protein